MMRRVLSLQVSVMHNTVFDKIDPSKFCCDKEDVEKARLAMESWGLNPETLKDPRGMQPKTYEKYNAIFRKQFR